MKEAKSFDISKEVVREAYKRVKANQGAVGVDEERITDFESRLKDNLYKIWNRMSSGTYFPRWAIYWVGRLANRQPKLFVHWQMGVRPATG